MASAIFAPHKAGLVLECSEPELFLDSRRTGFFAVWRVDRAAGAERRQAKIRAGVDPEEVARIGDGFQSVYPLSELSRVVAQLKGKDDHYISQLYFRCPRRRDGGAGVPNRRKGNAIGTRLCFLDFDIGIRRDQVDEALQRIFADAEVGGIPLPSYVVFSGRGLHVKWLLSCDIPQCALSRWDLVQKALLDFFRERHWAVDARAIDRSRVLRIPGTFNSKSGALCEVAWVNCSDTGAVLTYGFDALADGVLPLPRAQYLEEVRKAYDGRGREFAENKAKRDDAFRLRGVEFGEKKKAPNSRVAKGPRLVASNAVQVRASNPRQLAYKRAEDCLNVLRQRASVPGSATAYREPLIFWAVTFEALSGKLDSAKLADRAREIAAATCPPDWARRHECRWESHLSSVARRFGAWRAGDSSKVYTPKNQTLIDGLAITEQEQKHLQTIISPAEKANRKKERRREAGIDTREEYLRKVKVASAETDMPWQSAGISRSTWYRRKRAA